MRTDSSFPQIPQGVRLEMKPERHVDRNCGTTKFPWVPSTRHNYGNKDVDKECAEERAKSNIWEQKPP